MSLRKTGVGVARTVVPECHEHQNAMRKIGTGAARTIVPESHCIWGGAQTDLTQRGLYCTADL